MWAKIKRDTAMSNEGIDFTNVGNVQGLHTRVSSLFLFLLIFSDCIYIGLHSINSLTPILNSVLWDVESDWSYSEVFQYFKWMWVVILLLFIAKVRGSFSYVSWLLVFSYILFDDSLMLHDNFAAYVSREVDFIPPFGLSLFGLAELALSAAAGSILLLCVFVSYWRGSIYFKKVTLDLLLLFAALVFFGVAVDFLHISFDFKGFGKFLIGVIEDGGEMFVASLIVWYLLLLSTREDGQDTHLHDVALKFLKR